MYYHYVSTGIAFILLFIFWEIFFSIFSWKVIVSQWQTSPSSSSLKTIKYSDNGGVDNNDGDGGVDNNDGDGDGDGDGHQEQEIGNVGWLGARHNGKRKPLRNHPDDDEGQEGNGGSGFLSNNDESSNISDNDSITVNFMNL